jgi:hypothetical protein
MGEWYDVDEERVRAVRSPLAGLIPTCFQVGGVDERLIDHQVVTTIKGIQLG